jgi:hypothetical protein
MHSFFWLAQQEEAASHLGPQAANRLESSRSAGQGVSVPR